MSWLTASLRSSVGKKLVMGITGLFLCGFLVIHLAGNLLLYIGAEQYNHYALALHNNPPLLITAEIFLYVALAAHLYLAFVTTRDNWAARDSRYAVKRSKLEDQTINVAGYNASNTMFITGAVVLLFLILHLSDFKFEIGWSDVAELEPYDKAAAIMSNTARMVAYAIGSLFVGIHVSHGLASCFQSLGLNPHRFKRRIETASWIYGAIIAIGFASFALWGLSRAQDSATTTTPAPAEATHNPEAAPARHP